MRIVYFKHIVGKLSDGGQKVAFQHGCHHNKPIKIPKNYMTINFRSTSKMGFFACYKNFKNETVTFNF